MVKLGVWLWMEAYWLAGRGRCGGLAGAQMPGQAWPGLDMTAGQVGAVGPGLVGVPSIDSGLQNRQPSSLSFAQLLLLPCTPTPPHPPLSCYLLLLPCTYHIPNLYHSLIIYCLRSPFHLLHPSIDCKSNVSTHCEINNVQINDQSPGAVVSSTLLLGVIQGLRP